MERHIAFLIEADPGRVLANGPANDVYGMAGKLLARGYTSHNLFLFRESTVAPLPRLREPVEAAGITVVRTGAPLDEIQKILEARGWDVDHVILGISGDGSQVRDRDGDEVDGMDEVIGNIVDDRIFALLQKFRPETQVWLLTDSCHSGSLGDLPLVWRGDWIRNTRRKPDTDPRAAVVGLSPISDSLCVMSEFSEWYGGALFLGLIQESVLPAILGSVSKEAVTVIREEMTKWFRLLHENAASPSATIGELILTASRPI